MTRVLRLFGSRLFGSGLQFVITLLIARESSLSEFGNFSTVCAITAVVSGVIGLGLPNFALRVPICEQESDFPPTYGLALLAAGLAGALTLLSVVIVFHEFGTWQVAAVLFSVNETVHSVIQSLLLAKGQLRRAESVTVLRRVAPAGLVALSLITSSSVFTLASLGFGVSLVLGLAVSPVPPIVSAASFGLIARARPYWISSVGSVIQQLDVSIVNLAFGSSTAGAYSAAFRLASPVHLVTSSIVGVIVPDIANASIAERPSVVRSAMRFASGYALLLGAVSPALIWIGPILFGDDYAPLSWLFMVMMMNSAINVVNQIQGGILNAVGEPKWVAVGNTVATAAGMSGVAVASLFGSLELVAGSVVGIQMILVAVLGWRVSKWRS